jgi:arylsulfatase B
VTDGFYGLEDESVQISLKKGVLFRSKEVAMRHFLILPLVALFLFGCSQSGGGELPQLEPDTTTPVEVTDVGADTALPEGDAVSDGEGVAPPSSPPNILLVIADDLGLDATPCYGWPSATANTPVLDALCAKGVRFEQAWAHPTCSPTRASMLTGRYPFRTGVGSPTGGPGSPGISIDAYSLPVALEALAPVKYAHANIGKWHLADTSNGAAESPNNLGYSFYSGLLGGTLPDYYDWTKVTNGVQFAVTNYATTETVDDAIAWLSTVDKPWFLWLAFNAPHSPFHVPPSTLYSQNLAADAACKGGARSRCFRASIEALDAELGRLLEAIDDPNLDNTVVIFIGDNGTPGQVLEGYPDGRGKGTLYQGGIHVPLFIAGAGIVAAGRQVDSLVDATDIFATVLELAGASVPAQTPTGAPIDGQSLVPYLASSETSPIRDWVVAELSSSDDAFDGLDRAIRDSRYKLIQWVNGTTAFYDLSVDLMEENDLLLGTLTAEQQTAYDALMAQSAALQ